VLPLIEEEQMQRNQEQNEYEDRKKNEPGGLHGKDYSRLVVNERTGDSSLTGCGHTQSKAKTFARRNRTRGAQIGNVGTQEGLCVVQLEVNRRQIEAEIQASDGNLATSGRNSTRTE
jgi:hypothetical protein